jgi:GT2 family glycosyltransferase
MSPPAPLVTIVLPTLNGGRYIRRSIESCLSQTYTHFELIVVDGGSTDDTLDLVAAVADPRLRVIHQSNNTGRLPGALNCGFAQAQGALFTWTQDDDYYTPNALEVLVAAIEADPACGFVYAGYWFIDGEGDVLRPAAVGAPDELYQRNPVGHCFLYRREVAEQVGAYDAAFLMAEDTHYWMRVYRVAQMHCLPGRYFQHRLHPASLTMREYGRFTALRVAAQARRQVLRIPWLTYQSQLADAYIQEAFAARDNGDAARVRCCIGQGLLHNPAWLANRGVWSIAGRAWLARWRVS